MAFDFKSYASDEVELVIGPYPITNGRADGDFVSVEYNNDFHTISVGTDGEVTRSKVNDRSATITITLQQTSDANDLLTSVWADDLNSPGGNPVAFLLRDSNGRSLFAAEKCWVQTAPSATYGRDAGTREWVLQTNNLVAFFGGN